MCSMVGYGGIYSHPAVRCMFVVSVFESVCNKEI